MAIPFLLCKEKLSILFTSLNLKWKKIITKSLEEQRLVPSPKEESEPIIINFNNTCRTAGVYQVSTSSPTQIHLWPIAIQMYNSKLSDIFCHYDNH